MTSPQRPELPAAELTPHVFRTRVVRGMCVYTEGYRGPECGRPSSDAVHQEPQQDQSQPTSPAGSPAAGGVDVEAIRKRVEAATPGPWELGVSFFRAGVNDGTHKDWTPPSDIPQGQCTYCVRNRGELVGTEIDDEDGGTIHVHRREGSDDWHRLESSATHSQIIGSFDYDRGGVSSSREDADFIAHARQDIPALLDELTALRAERDRLQAQVREHIHDWKGIGSVTLPSGSTVLIALCGSCDERQEVQYDF